MRDQFERSWMIFCCMSDPFKRSVSCVREIIFKYTVRCRMRDSLKGPQWYSNVWQTVLKMLEVLFCCTRDPLEKLLNVVLLHERYEVRSKDPSVVSKILLYFSKYKMGFLILVVVFLLFEIMSALLGVGYCAVLWLYTVLSIKMRCKPPILEMGEWAGFT